MINKPIPKVKWEVWRNTDRQLHRIFRIATLKKYGG